jgi:hypothetical protein
MTDISIADFSLRIIDDSDRPCEWLLGKCKDFARCTSDPIDPIEIKILRDPSFIVGGESFEYERLQENDGFILRGYDFIAKRQAFGSEIVVKAHPGFGIAGLIRSLLSVLLLEKEGSLFHSASFEAGERAFLCAGPSGSGKTTLSRLLKDEFCVLSDETTAVRFKREKAIAYSTPFCGELGIVSGNISNPLEAVLFLRHAKENYITEIGIKDSISRLMGCIFLPLNSSPCMSESLELCEKIARSIGCFEFGFRPEKDSLEVLRGITRFSMSQA